VLERPQRAPASRLARLLLYSGHKRIVLLLQLLLMSLPACIIPVGPEFHDPSGVPNSAPYIQSSNPERGGVWQSSTFEIRFSDSNVEDNLSVRWIIDFPPSTLGTTMILPTDKEFARSDGRIIEGRSEKTFLCDGLRPLPTHQIMVVISDRDFDPGPGDPINPGPGGKTAVGTWTWNATDCQQQ
jgi:hypothetical protein